MKALELLYQYQQADEIAGGYMSKPIDEAISELEELQNRTCKNCNYFTSSPNTNKYDCCEKGISDSSISFCCNKWEAK